MPYIDEEAALTAELFRELSKEEQLEVLGALREIIGSRPPEA